MQPESPSSELTASESRRLSRQTTVWLVAFGLLSIWVFWRCGGFDVGSTVIQNGNSFVAGFAAVDHPFHTMRAWQLIESLRDGTPLRWVTTHQGGYPVEFYPMGVAWIEAGIWAISLGSLSIFTVHKIATLLIFLLPGVGFWILARGDRKSPAVGFLALALQVAIAGYWMAGGFTELVLWGLITNVTGATAALIATAALARFVIRDERGMGLLAIAAIALATYANPRSLLAIAVAAIAIAICALTLSGREMPPLKSVVTRIGTVAVIAGMTTATEVLSLFRYRDLYYFVNYEQYDSDSIYWTATVNAVTQPVLWLAVGGGIWAIASKRFPIARVASIALGLYVLVTLFLAGYFGDFDIIQQLEAPRLMPYQRLLMLFLAAFFVVRVIDALANLFRVGQERGVAVVAIAVIVLVVFIRPIGDIGEDFRGLPETPKIATAELSGFREAVRAADAAAPDGASILVIGTRFSWHERLWASLDTDRPLYYEHWLWSWNNSHEGPPSPSNPQCAFDNDIGNYYPCPDLTLTPEYLAAHGIGAVVVTNVNSHADTPDARDAARTSSELTEVSRTTTWDVYSVNAPTAIVTNGTTAPTALTIENEEISASFPDGTGDILVRVNWFPRWQATVNGEPVDVVRAEGGYMRLEPQPGPIELKLTYGMTALDWLTRASAVIGVIATIALALRRPGRLFGR